jgi:hypothetical protein
VRLDWSGKGQVDLQSDSEDHEGMRPKAWLTTLAISCVVSACGGGGEPEPGDSPVTDAFDADRAAAVADRCGWSVGHARAIGQERVQEDFIDATNDDDTGLLLETQEVRPGQQFAIALLNGTEDSISYGVHTHIEDAAGNTVAIKGPLGFPAIGLSAEAGEAGPCVTVSIPSSTAPGTYRAYLDDHDASGDLSAEVEVSGSPVPKPEWEQAIKAAARMNRN